ncbi:hypothetical protein REIFOR_02111 [Reinekea forsetii]|uniref:Uncharacterized protein n=1 Tax=Reinekea forsetii TaxID=1336806 RepID=A0A2K8KR82_9GAMM|nr:hypothetical protein REIFOR_02111 [Reinekea forsetii]
MQLKKSVIKFVLTFYWPLLQRIIFASLAYTANQAKALLTTQKQDLIWSLL